MKNNEKDNNVEVLKQTEENHSDGSHQETSDEVESIDSTSNTILESASVGENQIDVAEENQLEEEIEDKKTSRHLIVLYGFCMLIVLALGIIFYRFYPLPSKIAGDWIAHTTSGTYTLNNSGNKSTFTMLNMNGMNGYSMVFESTLTAENVNEYFVKDTTVSVYIDKDKFSEEQLKTLKDNKKTFKFKEESKTQIAYQYTKKGLKESFEGLDVNDYFKYMLKDYSNLFKGESIVLRNDVFATGGVTFKRDLDE